MKDKSQMFLIVLLWKSIKIINNKNNNKVRDWFKPYSNIYKKYFLILYHLKNMVSKIN